MPSFPMRQLAAKARPAPLFGDKSLTVHATAAVSRRHTACVVYSVAYSTRQFGDAVVVTCGWHKIDEALFVGTPDPPLKVAPGVPH